MILVLCFTGRHTVDIQVAGNQIEGSPFYIDVFDLSSIRIETRKGIVGETVGFSGKITRFTT